MKQIMHRLVLGVICISLIIPIAGASDYCSLVNFTKSYQQKVIGTGGLGGLAGEPSTLNDPANPDQLLIWYSNLTAVGGITPHPWYGYSSNGINWTTTATDLPSMQRISVYYESGTYYLFGVPVDSFGISEGAIKEYTSTDRIHFTCAGIAINQSAEPSWDGAGNANSFVWKEGDTYYMLFEASGSLTNYTAAIGLATSPDLFTWTKYSENPVMTETLVHGVGNPELIRRSDNLVAKGNHSYFMYYSGGSNQGETGIAWSPDLHSWKEIGEVFHGGTETPLWSYADASVIEFKGKTYLYNSPSNQENTGWIDLSVADHLNSALTQNYPPSIDFSGYVNAYDGTPVAGTTADIRQDDTGRLYHAVTTANGAYSTNGTRFLTGLPLSLNVTRTRGGEPEFTDYYVTLIPHSYANKSMYVNFTLVPVSPPCTGGETGGAARAGNLTGNGMTKGCGQPVPEATIGLIGRADFEHSIKMTGNVGWYLWDEGSVCTMPVSKRPYNVWGNKTGYKTQ